MQYNIYERYIHLAKYVLVQTMREYALLSMLSITLKWPISYALDCSWPIASHFLCLDVCFFLSIRFSLILEFGKTKKQSGTMEKYHKWTF